MRHRLTPGTVLFFSLLFLMTAFAQAYDPWAKGEIPKYVSEP